MPNIIKIVSMEIWGHRTNDEISVYTGRVAIKIKVSHALNLKQILKDLLWHWNLVGCMILSGFQFVCKV